MVLVSCSTEYIDVLSGTDFVFEYGYNEMFGIEGSRYLKIFLIPPTYLMTSCLQFAYSRLIFAMARSGLYPVSLGTVSTNSRAPRNAIIAGTVGVYVILVLGWVYSSDYMDIFAGGILAAACAYVSMFLSFIIFRLHFTGLDRQYVSKTGVIGAWYGALVSMLIVVSVVLTRAYTALVFLGMIFSFSVYYYFIASKRQRLSAEEKEVMLVLHVIKGSIASYMHWLMTYCPT